MLKSYFLFFVFLYTTNLKAENHVGNEGLNFQGKVISSSDQGYKKALELSYNYQYDSAINLLNILIHQESHDDQFKTKLKLLEARFLFKKGLIADSKSICDSLENALSEREIQNVLGYLSLQKAYYIKWGDWDELLSLLSRSIEKIPKNDPLKLDAYLYYTDMLTEYGDLIKAQSVNQLHFELIDSSYSHDDYYKARFLLMKGYLEFKKGNVSQAISIYEGKLLSVLQKNDKYGWSKYTLSEMYRIVRWPYEAIGDELSALKYCLKYYDLFNGDHEGFTDKERYGEVLNAIAYHYEKLGFINLSGKFKHKYNELFNEENSTIYYAYKALVHYENGQYEDAKIGFLNALEFIRKEDMENFHETMTHYYLSRCYFFLNEKDKAFRHAEISMDLINQKLDKKTVKYLIDDNYFELMKFYDIDIMHNKFLRNSIFSTLDKTSSSNINLIRYYNNISNVLIDDENYDSANFFLDKVLKENQEHVFTLKSIQKERLKTLLVQSKYLKSLVDLRRKNISENQFLIELDGFISLCISRSYKSQRDYFLSVNFTQRLINVGFKICFDETSSKHSRMLNYIEKSKSATLTQSLNRNTALQQTNIPDTIQLKINSLKHQDSFLTTQINKLEKKKILTLIDSSKLSDFKSVLLDNKVEFNSLMLHLEKNFPNYYEVNYNPKIATIESVQQNLKPNEALLEYFVGSDGVYAFTIAKDTAQVFKLDSLQEESIKEFQDVIQPESFMANQSNSYQQYTSQAFELYEKFVDKPLGFLQGKGINKLYIVPDKSLNYLPFELLLSSKPAGERVNYKKLDYLLNDYSISYAYSASILFRENPMRREKTQQGKVLAVAPSYAKILNDTAQLAKLGKFRDGFEELKYNKEEVDGIGQYFDGEILKGDDATEEAFSEKFQDYDILHLAMHALVDNDDSEKSRLVFTPQEDSVYDSYLHNFELYNLNMNPKLAVLSACNTGFGSLESGEGVMSLARAFTYAGAESVVMSHWRVDDEASSIIMKSFYKYLADGNQKDEALRLAKLDYLQNAPAYAQHPFHWNNFVVIGDVSSLASPKSWYKDWWVYVSVFTALFVLAIGYKNRQRLFS